MKVAILINAAVFLLFILFLPFRDRIEWHSKGVLSAVILSLFAEMFGVPLLIFLLQPLGADYQLWDSIGLGQIKSSIYYFSKHWPTRAVGVWMTLIGMLLVFFGKKIHPCFSRLNSPHEVEKQLTRKFLRDPLDHRGRQRQTCCYFQVMIRS